MNQKTRNKLMNAVIRGVRLLDKKDPLWWNGGDTPPVIEGMVGHIDLERLDLSEATTCVLGQRHRHEYLGGLWALGLAQSDPADFGFNISSRVDRQIPQYSLLTELWASVIQSRRFPRRKIASDPWVMKANETWVKRLPV